MEKLNGGVFPKKRISGFFQFPYSVNKLEIFSFVFHLKHLFGWSILGFKNLLGSVGLIAEFGTTKDLMDDSKVKIVSGLKEKPLEFFFYAMNDIFGLFCMVKKKIISWNAV